ncbi:hypothetical protein BS78_07G095600 [Paspalum vaginatum]|nr:hypothetical protein BS78_07G095600 [Paspalum vaginatum]
MLAPTCSRAPRRPWLTRISSMPLLLACPRSVPTQSSSVRPSLHLSVARPYPALRPHIASSRRADSPSPCLPAPRAAPDLPLPPLLPPSRRPSPAGLAAAAAHRLSGRWSRCPHRSSSLPSPPSSPPPSPPLSPYHRLLPRLSSWRRCSVPHRGDGGGAARHTGKRSWGHGRPRHPASAIAPSPPPAPRRVGFEIVSPRTQNPDSIAISAGIRAPCSTVRTCPHDGLLRRPRRPLALPPHSTPGRHRTVCRGPAPPA